MRWYRSLLDFLAFTGICVSLQALYKLHVAGQSIWGLVLYNSAIGVVVALISYLMQEKKQ
jgi:hypothetical protein